MMFWLFVYICYLIFNQPVGIVVPHHNIVAERRIQMLKIIKQKRIFTDKIVVISPDHFSSDQRSIYYSDANWNFKNSNISYDSSFDKYLNSNIKLNNNLVKGDHGAFNILTDLSVIWPKSKVVPILIGQQIDLKDMDEFIQNLNNYCGYNCLLVSSVDFSHYLPYKLADIHDQESISALINMNLKDSKQIEVDSPQSIYSLINFSNNKHANKFVLYDHTNSAELVGNKDSESTSHIFGWYERNLFGKHYEYNVKTFTNANNLSKNDNLHSLGERFFYGIDELNLFDSKISKNIIVAGYETEKEVKKEYLPLTCNEKRCFFARGEEKKKLLQNILGEVDNQDGEITITKD